VNQVEMDFTVYQYRKSCLPDQCGV